MREEQYFQQASQPLREAAIAGMNLKAGKRESNPPTPPGTRSAAKAGGVSEEKRKPRSGALLAGWGKLPRALAASPAALISRLGRRAQFVRRSPCSYLLHFAAPAIAAVAAHSHDFCTAIQSLQPRPRLVPSGRSRVAGFPGKGALPRVPRFLLKVYKVMPYLGIFCSECTELREGLFLLKNLNCLLFYLVFVFLFVCLIALAKKSEQR